MLSTTFAVCLVIVAFFGAKFDHFHKEESPDAKGFRRFFRRLATPAGWIILFLTVGFTIWNSYETKAKQDYLRRELVRANESLLKANDALSKTNASISLLSQQSLKNFNDDLTLRISESATDSVIKMFRLQVDSMSFALANSSNGILPLNELATLSVTYEQATADAFTQNNKELSDRFIMNFDSYVTILKTLSSTHIELLNQMGAPFPKESMANVELSLKRLSEMSRSAKSHGDLQFGMTQLMTIGHANVFKSTTDLILTSMEMAAEVAYAQRLKNIGVIPPISVPQMKP